MDENYDTQFDETGQPIQPASNPRAAILVLLGLLIGPVMIAVIMSAVPKSTAIYKQTLSEVQNNQAVIAELGEPIKAGFFVNGSIEEEDYFGNATLKFRVSGPDGKGRVFAAARKEGNWYFLQLTVTIDDKVILVAGEQK